MKDIERMLVSAHEDGEVESPWKEQVERRIATDGEWGAEAQRQRLVKQALAASPEPDWSESLARVRTRLEAHTGAGSSRRSISLAWLSVAAAVLLVVAAGGGYWLGRQSGATSASEVAELKVQVPKTLGLQLSGEGQLIMASTLSENRR